MFATPQHPPSPARLAAPPGAKDTLHRSPATRQHPPNTAWHQLATNVRVSEPHEPAEREADRAADAVVQGYPVAVQAGLATGAAVHRMCAECEDEQHKHEEEGPVHAKRQAGMAGAVTGDAGHLAALEGRGQPLPDGLRGELEPSFGRDFSDVRLHTDAAAGESARAFDARAYTYGRHVVFGAGQFDPASTHGRHLLAHELTHVVQQSGQSRPGLQRQKKGGPLDLQPDPCITVPGLGQACGSDAAKVCAEVPSLPGCSAICKVFDCSKPKEPKTFCPPGWRAAASKDFEGQCCQGTIDSAQACCTPDRIALLDNRCCGADQVVSDNRCKNSRDLLSLPPTVCPLGQQTLKGDCCLPPRVSNGLECVLPNVTPPKPPPKPQPVVPKPIDIYFKLDRPREGETAAALAAVTTGEGKANFDALVTSLKADSTLKAQLVGRGSPEGAEAYNLDLGARRARLIAEALKGAGISGSRIADVPDGDLRGECQPVGTGLQTCGKAGATGARDREVMARVFQTP
jgi:Domain of unknown function (DUF4157)